MYGDPLLALAFAPVHATLAPATEKLAVRRVLGDLLGGHRRRHLDHGHLDQLPLAGAVAVLDGGDERGGGVDTDGGIDEPARDDGRTALVAGAPRHAGDLLHR